jgi:hypothetical protein
LATTPPQKAKPKTAASSLKRCDGDGLIFI